MLRVKLSKTRRDRLKVEMYLNGDVLDFLNECSDEFYETQINSELRGLIKSEKQNEVV